MSEEERLLRLENAVTTLAELAAGQQRLSAEQQRQSADQERIISEQQRQMGDQQRRTARPEESFLMLTEMLGRHEDSFGELRAAQAETEQKIASLVDAIIRIEEAHGSAIGGARAAQADTDRKLAALVDAQIRIEEAHSRGGEELRASTRELQAGMEEVRAAQADAYGKIAALAEAMKQLAESQAHTDRRLDGLIDIVRELRNGRG